MSARIAAAGWWTRPGAPRGACGKKKQFVCGFHAWRYNLEGQCTHVLEKEDWKGALTNERTRLGEVKVDTWGGWIWINMDPDCEPLRDFLEPAASMLDPFELQNMRYRWRRWIVFDCNWKVAMEAFAETYHVPGTHPEFMRFGDFRGWARAQGKHSNIGYDAPKGLDENQAKLRLGAGADPRISTAEMQVYTWEQVNTNTTQDAGRCGAPAGRRVAGRNSGRQSAQALARFRTARRCRARRDLADRRSSSTSARAAPPGRSSPTFRSGTPSTTRCATAPGRYGYDPNKCIFEVVRVSSCSRRARSRRPSGNTRRWTTQDGAASCRRTFPTWPRYSRA